LSYTDTLLEFAEKGECPGCGPTLVEMPDLETEVPFHNLYKKYCTCCGWVLIGDLTPEGKITNPGFGKRDMSEAGEELVFLCALIHPEHRASWPQPERDESQPDPLTLEELAQEAIRLDGHHYNLASPEERCGSCKAWAPHKISEERPNFYGHAHTAALCCNCFERIFGPHSHPYPRLDTPLIFEATE
jgi:hypothetical protein